VKLVRNERAKFELDEFLARPLMAHLATSVPDGARDSPLWYIWEDGALWIIVQQGFNTFHQRAAEQPSAAVGIVDFDPVEGRLQHVGVRGRASLVAWDDARASRLLRRYYRHLPGYVVPAPSPSDRTTSPYPMVFLRVDPDTVVLREQSYRDEVMASKDW